MHGLFARRAGAERCLKGAEFSRRDRRAQVRGETAGARPAGAEKVPNFRGAEGASRCTTGAR